MSMVKRESKPKCYWCAKDVNPKVGVHEHCYEALKGFALSVKTMPDLRQAVKR